VKAIDTERSLVVASTPNSSPCWDTVGCRRRPWTWRPIWTCRWAWSGS
jgi:hypothetical protein